MENRLYRDENRKVIGGVCAGLADYFNIDDTIMRLIFVFAVMFLGVSFWLYIILWIVLPPKFVVNPGVDYTVPSPAGPVRPVRAASAGGVILGFVFIVFGAMFLLNEYDLLPDLEYHKLWPLVLVVLGIAIIFGAGKRKAVPDQFEDWHNEQTENNDNPETV